MQPSISLVYAAQSTGSYTTEFGSPTYACLGGETLLCSGSFLNSGSEVGPPTDSVDTFAAITSPTAYVARSGNSTSYGGWYLKQNASAGAHTLTPQAVAGGADGLVRLIKLTRMKLTGGAIDGNASRQVSGSTSFSLTTGGAPVAGHYAFGVRTHENNVGSVSTITQPAGWTSLIQYLQGGTNLPTDVSYKKLTSGGAVTGAWSSSDGAITDTSGAIVVLAPLVFTLEQLHYRFRNDDGSETTATWAQSEDTGITAPLGANLRLRMLLDQGGTDASPEAYRLEYKLSSDSVYKPVGPAASAAVTWGAVGTTGTGTTSATPAYPTGISASTSKLYCLITGRSNTATTAPTMPAGWTNVTDLEGGNTATFAADAGTRRVTLFRKDAVDGTETGTVTVSLAGNANNTLRAVIFRVEVPAGWGMSELSTTGQDTSSGTGFSITGSGTLAWAVNDLLLIAVTLAMDTTNVGSQSITASGVTFGTRTNRVDAAVTNGFDHKAYMDSVPVTAVGSASAPTFAATLSVASAGPGAFLLLRATPPPISLALSSNITASGEATTAQLSAPSGKTTSDFSTGRMQDDENPADSVTIAAAKYTELEWCLIAQSPAVNGDIYQFRVVATGDALDTYTVTPAWTIGSGGGVSVNLTGVSGTGSPGTLSAVGGASIAVGGVSATGQAGSIAPSGAAAVPLTGAGGSGAAGDVLAAIGISTALTGVSGAGTAGSIAPVGAASVAPTGVSGTGSPGDLGAAEFNAVALSGVSATGSPGTLAAQGAANVTPTGVSGSGLAGDLSVTGAVAIILGGVSGTGQVGDLTAMLGTLINLSGVEANGAAGDFSVRGQALVTVTGVTATGAAGEMMAVVDDGVLVNLSGVEANGQAGSLSIAAHAQVPLVGVIGQGQAGVLAAVSTITIDVDGVQADGSPGFITITGNASVALTGTEALGQVGALLGLTDSDRGSLPDPVTVVLLDPRTIRVRFESRTVRVGKLN